MAGKCRDSKYKGTIPLGTKYGNWEVISDVFQEGKYKKCGDKTYWVSVAKIRCRCICGNESDVSLSSLLQGTSRGCTCGFSRSKQNNPSWRGYEDIPGAWLKRYRNHKEERKSFLITPEEIWSIYLSQDKKCALSGLPVDFEGGRYPDGRKSTVCSASLDRIDSLLPYTKENCQIVHKDVNRMKNAYPQEYFIQMCISIANNMKSCEVK